MSDYVPTPAFVEREYVTGRLRRSDVTAPEARAEFDRMIAEVELAAAEKALTDMANELSLMDDGGKRGLAGHSKSSASAITHRHAVAVLRARAAEIREGNE